MNVAKISIVGVGMRSNAGLRREDVRDAGRARINLLAVTTSEIKVSVLIPEEYTWSWRSACSTPPSASTPAGERHERRRDDRRAPRRPWRCRAWSVRLKELMARGTEFLGTEWAIMGGAMSWIRERHLVSASPMPAGSG